MSTKIYNKLVRDKIPEIIEASGKTCSYKVLSDDNYVEKLEQKLSEELAEYQSDRSIEEMADLYEVMMATVKARGWTMEQLEAVRINKAKKRGGFEKKIMLKEVYDK